MDDLELALCASLQEQHISDTPEWKKMENALQLWNLQPKTPHTPGDGNCFFHALHELTGLGDDHGDMRRILLQYGMNNIEWFKVNYFYSAPHLMLQFLLVMFIYLYVCFIQGNYFL